MTDAKQETLPARRRGLAWGAWITASLLVGCSGPDAPAGAETETMPAAAEPAESGGGLLRTVFAASGW